MQWKREQQFRKNLIIEKVVFIKLILYILIYLHPVHYCTRSTLERFSKNQWPKDYYNKKKYNITDYYYYPGKGVFRNILCGEGGHEQKIQNNLTLLQ